jgi:hypothetical protein
MTTDATLIYLQTPSILICPRNRPYSPVASLLVWNILAFSVFALRNPKTILGLVGLVPACTIVCILVFLACSHSHSPVMFLSTIQFYSCLTQPCQRSLDASLYLDLDTYGPLMALQTTIANAIANDSPSRAYGLVTCLSFFISHITTVLLYKRPILLYS